MRLPITILLCALAIPTATAHAQDTSPRGRGELLYSTHCVDCHTTQMHWRDKKVARDLNGLRAQVVRWQGNVGRNWDASEIGDVVDYLNRTFYKFPARSQKG